MKALRFHGAGSALVDDLEEPVPGEDDVLVEPAWVGLCGTDLELFTGVMPYFAEGNARYPLQPGHEVAGTVCESRSAAWNVGDRVVVDPVVGCGDCAACSLGRETHCPDRKELGVRRGLAGGAAELVVVPGRKLHRVSDDVALRDAVLVEPAVTVLNGLKRVGLPRSSRALVIGAGTLGLIAVQLLSASGAEVDVLVLHATHAELVEELGASPVLTPAGSGYEVVVEAAGTPLAVQQALSAVAPGGRIALTGVLPGLVDELDVNAIVLKDVTVFGVLNGPGLYDETLEALRLGQFRPAALIDREFTLGDAAAAFEELAGRVRRRPKLLLRIGGAL